MWTGVYQTSRGNKQQCIKMRFWRIYYRLGQFGKEMVHNKGGKMLNRQVYVSDNEFIIARLRMKIVIIM